MSLIARYRGNSAPGQLVDSSGHGHTLTVAGTSVPNPASPTPPEGDRWLAGPAVDVSYLEVPAAVAAAMTSSGAVVGRFQTTLSTNPNRALDDILISMNGTVNYQADKLFCYLDSVAALGSARLIVIQVQPILIVMAHTFIDAGGPHDFEMEWDGTGTRLYLDGALVASTATVPTIPTNKPSLAGYDFTGSSQTMDYGYLDDVRFRTQHEEDEPDDNKTIEGSGVEGGEIEGGSIEGGSIG